MSLVVKEVEGTCRSYTAQVQLEDGAVVLFEVVLCFRPWPDPPGLVRAYLFPFGVRGGALERMEPERFNPGTVMLSAGGTLPEDPVKIVEALVAGYLRAKGFACK